MTFQLGHFTLILPTQRSQETLTVTQLVSSRAPRGFSGGADDKESVCKDFPGGSVVKTSSSNAGDAGSIPGQGAKIPHAFRPKNQNIKQKQYCTKFNKYLKLVHFKKILYGILSF